jgi:hypothetical protein
MKELIALGVAIVIGIILLLPVGSQISASQQNASDARWGEDINFMAIKMMQLFALRPNRYGTGCYTDASLVRIGVYPEHVVNASGAALNEYGGAYAVCGAGQTVWIYTSAQPATTCANMLQQATNIQRVVNVRVGANLAAAQAATPIAAKNIALDTAVSTCSATSQTVGFEVR